MTYVDAHDDTIDMGYVLDEIDELEGILEEAMEDEGYKGDVDDYAEACDFDEDDEELTKKQKRIRAEVADDAERYRALKTLESDVEAYASDNVKYTTLISDTYFEQYAELLAEDIGAIDRNAKWPLNHIDWEAAANELKQDYTSVEFEGVEFWFL